MASFNRVILVGNLTRDPELKYIPSGSAVTEIGLAVNERHKNANGDWVDTVNFFDVTLWARTAEIACEYLSKGSSVLIEGHLKMDSWEKDGKKNYKLRIVGERMQMLGSKGGSGSGGGGNRGGAGAARGGSGGPSYDESEAPSFGGDSYEDAPAGAPSGGRAPSRPAPAGDDIPF